MVERHGRIPTRTEPVASDTCNLPPKRRGGANRKERKRTQTMNTAFSELRNRIPNVPPDTKLSKIKTLRLAISYIRYLMDVLAEDVNKEGKLRSHKDFVMELADQNDRRDKRKKEETVSLCFVYLSGERFLYRLFIFSNCQR